jgi:Ricin-type beta-trefoil lectin domain
MPGALSGEGGLALRASCSIGLGDPLHRFGSSARHRRPRKKLLGAGVAAVCLLGAGLASMSINGAAGAATSPTTPLPVGSAAPAAQAPAGAFAKNAGGRDCGTPSTPLQMDCMLIIKHGKRAAGQTIRQRGSAARPAATISAPLGPADLQAAYGLAGTTGASATDGVGVTVAIVDAYGDTNGATGVVSDVATYRSLWSLPACNSTTGAGCVSLFNQNGATSPLPANPNTPTTIGWMDETALDAEMVSAICPNCHIDIFEANSDGTPDLGTAENSAAQVSKYVSNSWGGEDFPGEAAYDSLYYNHPGVVTDFAAGDYGYGAEYPAASGLVTAVGGTYLSSSTSTRGYSEAAWTGTGTQNDGTGYSTGAGCSSGEGQPSWQAGTEAAALCQNRMGNDVSAVANAQYGIDLLSSGAGDCDQNGAWGNANECPVEGTSVSTPIITAIYALANGTTGPVPNTYPSSYLYQAGHAGNASDFNDVTSGEVSTCESNLIARCEAVTGYDGPTGWGTPNGIAGFASTATGDIVSIVNPGNYDLEAGGRYSLPAIKALDSASGQALTYSLSGLPSGSGLTISTSGVIGGTLSATPFNARATVTVAEASNPSVKASVTFNLVSVKSLTASYHATSGYIHFFLGGKCMNDRRNGTGSGTPVEAYTCENAASETGWSLAPSGAPGVPGTVRIHGLCLGANGAKNVGIYTCNGTTGEDWFLSGLGGELINASSGLCVQGTTTNGTQLTVATCTGGANQEWMMPASPITSGVAGKCLALSGSSIVSATCAATSGQEITLGPDGTLQVGGKCIYKTGSSWNDGTGVGIYACNGNPVEYWGISAYGQLENQAMAFEANVPAKCLAIPNNSSTNNTKLVIEDCYNQPGEVWGVS